MLGTQIELIINRERLVDPFQPEIILVQNMGMAHWIQMFLSRKFSVAANIRFQSPKKFIWEMFVHIRPGLPQKSAFTKQNIRWKLMTLLPEILEQVEFITLQRYLNKDSDQKKLFQLASRIAVLYDQYLVYRPTWLTSWESGLLIEGLGKAQIWQALLWKALVELIKNSGQSEWHCANLYNWFIATSLASEINLRTLGLPSRIFIFGISTLPSIYLNILKELSKCINVYILFINPCRRHCWGNIKDAHYLEGLPTHHQNQSLFGEHSTKTFKTDNNISQFFDNKKEIKEITNPLLDSWGKLGRDYIYMLSNISSLKKRDIDVFKEIIPDTLLHNVQLDILNLENRAVVGITIAEFSRSNMKRRLDPEDRSLAVHICHSPQREIEVLHDQLLTMLEEDPNLTPHDIVVMAADIDNYIPYIKAVFEGSKGNRYIPYSISDCRENQFRSETQAFMSLLSLLESRFISREILAFLEVPVVAARFNMSEQDLQYLRQWINESGIRWGLDDDNVKEFELPITGQHTWKFGLTRMLLGYAMESTQGEWKEVLPYDEPSGIIAEIVGNLGLFLIQLTRWRRQLKQARTLEAWLPFCREILNDFFLLNNQTETALFFIEQQWKAILNEGIASKYSKTIPLSLLRDELSQRLNQKHVKEYFLVGGVNICTIMMMRSIPFKVICLLGMNDGIYPRAVAPLGFNLMNQHLKYGDRNQRDDDRYLFLETLISAQKTLYISYVGRSMQDNSRRFSSILVEELLDYIGQSHYLPGDELCNCDISEQHVKTHITFLHSRMPFDPINYEQNKYQSYVREWLPAAKQEGTPQTNFIQTLKSLPIETIEFEKLQDFWSHPVRAFFKQRLHVNFYAEELEIPDTEPFFLKGLNCYQLNQELLDALVEQKDEKILFRRYRAAGQLPYGVFGEIFWEKQYQEMQELAERIIKNRQPEQNMEIDLDCNGFKITGWLQRVQSDGLLRWRPSIFSISQGLQLWIEHLIYIASGNEGESRLLMRKDSEWRFPSIPIETAKNYLNLFVEGYLEGINKPLLLPLESGGAWIKACYDMKNDTILTDKKSLQKARNEFFRTYKSSIAVRGEGESIWYQRLWRNALETKHFDIITKEAQRYLLPLFKFNQS